MSNKHGSRTIMTSETHPTHNTSLCVVPAKEVRFGVRKMKFDPFYPLPPKNVKIETLSWRSIDNSSRPNSGTVSSKLVQLLNTQVTSRDMTPRSRGQGHNGT